MDPTIFIYGGSAKPNSYGSSVKPISYSGSAGPISCGGSIKPISYSNSVKTLIYGNLIYNVISYYCFRDGISLLLLVYSWIKLKKGNKLLILCK